MADDILEGLDRLGFQGGVGIGHSLGAVLTLYAAVRRPGLFSRVILIDPTMLPPAFLWKVRLLRLVGLDARPRLVEGALRRRRTWESGEAAYRYFRERKNFTSWSDPMVRAYTEGITAPSPSGGVQLSYPPEWEARIYQTIPTDVWKKASLLHIPTLVIRGEASNTFTAESERAFRKAFPAAQFRAIPGAGHLVVQEKPDEIGEVVRDFLR
jgi:pimeloyl-ACP methyl ester carboxylesterase